jgi:hypothetical protein
MSSRIALQPLQAHPRSAPPPGVAVRAGVRRAGALDIVWEISWTSDSAGLLRFPASRLPDRRDGLWQHSCVEVFLAPAGHRSYHEWNFAPSGHWAAYTFDDYRGGMAALEVLTPPAVHWQVDDRRLQARVSVPLPAEWEARALQAGLAVVLEDTSGRMSHWALHHPAERADFHHRDGFILPLQQADRAS